MKKTLLAASLGLVFFLPPAEAGVFNFSFTLSDNRVFSGKIDGTLQADNNTVLVNSVLDFASFDGIPLPSITFIRGEKSDISFLSLDGSLMNLIAEGAIQDYSVGFSFGSNKVQQEVSFSFYDDFHEIYVGGGGLGETYVTGNWSLTSSSESLPVPATLPLLAMGGLFMACRRRKAS